MKSYRFISLIFGVIICRLLSTAADKRNTSKNFRSYMLTIIFMFWICALYSHFCQKGLAEFRLVTAFSNDHYLEALKSCESLGSLKETKNWMPGYMIAYLLKNDMSSEQIAAYKKNCPFVTVRYFNEKRYPDIAERTYEYRWKPIIFEEVFREAKTVFWVDASILFKTNNEESIIDILENMETNFSKCGIRYFSQTIHSIYSATHPSMLRYFNISEKDARKTPQFESGWFVMTKKASNIVNKWKECALQKECFAPTGAHLDCDVPKLYSGEYGNCHRYDQSALSLLVLQCTPNSKDYFKPTPLLSAKRLGFDLKPRVPLLI